MGRKAILLLAWVEVKGGSNKTQGLKILGSTDHHCMQTHLAWGNSFLKIGMLTDSMSDELL